MHDGDLSPFGKTGVVLILAFAVIAALYNVARGTVVHPRAFWIVLAGLSCFLVGKLSVVAQRRWVSFGPARMSPSMANLYRVGYWLIGVGILSTFA